MKIKTMMIITAVITALFGLAFVIIPRLLLELYGNSPEAIENTRFTGQLFGTALITLALINWLLRNTEDILARNAIALAFCLGSAAGFVVSLIAQIEGLVNSLGWSTVVIYFLLMVGFGYFRFVKSSSE